MDAEKLEAFRARLRAQRAELKQVDLEPLRDDAQSKVDEDLKPLAEMNQMIASSRNRNRAGSLRQIDAALARIRRDPEMFGLCEDCEEPIPDRRLELMPWTTLCVKCQSEREEVAAGRTGRRRHLGDFT